MEYIFLLFYFCSGLCVGSFLSLCASRLPRGESILWPPSHCDACGVRLGVRDLIPLWSFWHFGGQCRRCGSRLPNRLWQQELAVGILFLGLGLGQRPDPALFFRFYFASGLALTSWLDWEEQFIYDCVLAMLLGGGLVRAFLTGLFWEALWGALVLGVVMLVIYWAARGGMGFGDVKLCAVLGLWLGAGQGLWALFLSSLAGCLGAAVLFLLRRRSPREPLPYAPFLCGSALFVHVWGSSPGPALIKWVSPF